MSHLGGGLDSNIDSLYCTVCLESTLLVFCLFIVWNVKEGLICKVCHVWACYAGGLIEKKAVFSGPQQAYDLFLFIFKHKLVTVRTLLKSLEV